MAPRNPCSYLPRRLQIVASLALFIVFCIFFLGTSNASNYDPYLAKVPYGSQIQSGAHQAVDSAHQVVNRLPKLPKDIPFVSSLNPFRTPAHSPPPPIQANSSSGEARWYSDWKWRNPFSSSVTLDEERAVLPPLKVRPPIYTYFDPANRRTDEKSKKAEADLLQIWRRSWWAQGFRPVVLGRSEALNNPLYRTVQGLHLATQTDFEMMRWLAWGNMGTGILCNWLAVPMSEYNDPLLSYLRRGEYPRLTRFEGLENGLFTGTKDDVNIALKTAIASPTLNGTSSIYDAVPGETFNIDPQHDGVAFYSTKTIRAKYSLIREKLAAASTLSDGMALLPPLINSHLHTVWQNTFSTGIAVLKPLPESTTSLITSAVEIARNLSQCPFSPIPASCPPNRPRCKPCVSSQPPLISIPPVFRNTSTRFTIGTVPHPYTLTALLFPSRLASEANTHQAYIPFVRRDTTRDAWIQAATKELLGTGLPSYGRLVHIKDAVASDYGAARSLWLTAEQQNVNGFFTPQELEDLDWHFGFTLPRAGTAMPSGKSETPVPGPERRPPPPKQEFGDGPLPSDNELAAQKGIVERAQRAISDGRGKKGTLRQESRDLVEAWNMADTEAWKFVRAFNARRAVERAKWEEEEEAFLGKGAWGRWIDKIA